ncbi:MAG TPA: SH3 domain-containing protein [Cyclobacteriaceae bacterium]
MFLIIFLHAGITKSQASNDLLLKADSLFQQKRYTQSFEIYQSLFQGHQYTPAMLLKMAYIQEGLNRISQSAYYLNLYYLASRDEAALTKLEELADKYHLDGYANSETDRFFSLYSQYRDHISIAFAAALILLSVICSVQRLKFGDKPYAVWGCLIALSIVFLMHLNFSDRQAQAIIVNNNSYLMDNPSAGASVISIVRDGHRVQVLGKKDVWLRIEWGEGEAYIKENNLLPVKL